MRRALPFALTTWLATSLAGAQPPSPCSERPNAVVADLGLHVVNAGYQRTLGCGVVAQATAGLYVPWTVNDDVLGLGGGPRPPGSEAAGAVLRVRAFFFPLGNAPTGFWISPFVQPGYVRGNRGTERLGGIAFAAGVSAGSTWLLWTRLLVALGIGAQLHTAFFDGSTEPPGFARIGPTIDLNLAYTF